MLEYGILYSARHRCTDSVTFVHVYVLYLSVNQGINNTEVDVFIKSIDIIITTYKFALYLPTAG